MKKVTFLSALVGITMLFALNANATTITGITTLNNSIAQVGKTTSTGKTVYYIPLTEPAGVYGDDVNINGNGPYGYGTSSDSGITPLDGPLMDMFLYYNIGVGNKGVAMNFWFKDLDLGPDNDPTGFFESVKIIDADAKINNLYTNWSQFSSIGTRTQFGTGNNYSVDIDGLNIMANSNGDFWLHLQFRAWTTDSLPWDDGTTLYNTAEKLRVTMETEPVPEPATIALLGIGIVGFAGVAARRKLRKSQNK